MVCIVQVVSDKHLHTLIVCYNKTVGPSHPEIIGLPGTSGLCTLGSRYNVGFLIGLSIDRNLNAV